jgi:hypothetical protein
MPFEVEHGDRDAVVTESLGNGRSDSAGGFSDYCYSALIVHGRSLFVGRGAYVKVGDTGCAATTFVPSKLMRGALVGSETIAE